LDTDYAANSDGDVVRTEGLWKLFRLGDEVVKALRGVTVRIRPGEFVCVMGPSGSGRSTLLHLVGGLERPKKGEITLDGQPLSGLTESQLSRMTASLDRKNSTSIVESLGELDGERGMTTLVATHDLSVAGAATRVIEMRDGKAISDSAPPDPAPDSTLAPAG
jgi:ABC-type lipoprotein export system ATPase subunit